MWIGDLRPPETCEMIQTLKRILYDNHYSTIVDLEKELFEIERYASYYSSAAGYKQVHYLEVDKRCHLQEKTVFDLFASADEI